MSKRIVLALSIFSLNFSVALAGSMGNNGISMIQNGFYVAGDMGAAGLGIKESHFIEPESHQLGTVGLIGGGYAGYEYGFNNYGVALEFFADGTGLNAAVTHSPYTYHHHQSYDLGVRVLPEYAFTPMTTGHVILGYTNGRFNISDNGVYGYINTSYNKSGFQTGLGFTTALRNNVSFRLDAIYDIYGSQTNAGAGLTSGTTQLYTNTFSTLAGEASLIYKFN